MCLLDDDLRSVVDEAQSRGWAYVNEGTLEKPKRGYVASTPGSRLVMRLRAESLLEAPRGREGERSEEAAGQEGEGNQVRES